MNLSGFLVTGLFVSLAINFLMFIVAFIRQTDRVTDASYAATFIALAVYGYIRSMQTGMHRIVLVMICVWALRLGGFLVFRIWKTGRDSRFDDKRSSVVKFGSFWLLQALTVWLLMLGPGVFFYQQKPHFGSVSIFGAIVWLIGLVIETTSDLQKYAFMKSTSKPNPWIASGLWKYSRHPNYLGEMLVWWGMAIVILTNSTLTQVPFVLASPAVITLLLLFISGIPLLEKSADAKWGNNKAYQAYKTKTPVLLPFLAHKS